jgi:beta-catenin-like protein 1
VDYWTDCAENIMSSNGNGNVEAVLDRMGMGSVAMKQGDGDADADYLPSATWQGPKTGYYFGTSTQGTGYYRDKQLQQSSKRKRMVRIAEDQNEMRLLPKTLLEQAEQQASGSTVIELTPKGIQSASNALTKLVNQNAMQRIQFANEPQQYMGSELALYEQLTALQAIAANAQLYQHLVDNQTLLSTLTQLLGHENTDVCASVIALFLEWIDPSLLDEDPDLIWILGTLATRILEDAWETVVANLARFQQQKDGRDESQDQTLKGIDNSLSLMENLLELDLLIPNGVLGGDDDDEDENNLSAAAYMVKETGIVSWFFQQIQMEEAAEEFKGRCMELLAFVSQREDVHAIIPDWSKLTPFSATMAIDDEEPKEKKKKEEEIQGIEVLLQIVGGYKKKQPESDNEVEFLENACSTLSSSVTFSTANLQALLEGQGIELTIRCLKEQVHAGGSALKLLDFFGGDPAHKQACEHLVEAGGLKYLFPIFLGTRIPKLAPSQATTVKAKREWLHTVEAQTIRIFYALSRHLDDKSPEDGKARFLTKFVQDDRKCDRLVELLLSYDQKARKAEYNFYRSDVEEQVEEEETVQLAALDAKLKGGGDLFHRLGAISACVCVHSKRCHERILSQLQLQQSGISVVKAALEEFISVLEPGTQKEQLEYYLTKI